MTHRNEQTDWIMRAGTALLGILAAAAMAAVADPPRGGNPSNSTIPAAPGPATRPHGAPAVFRADPNFGEEILAYRFEPGVQVRVIAPPATQFDRSMPTRVIIYALPNGNTTDQTIGKRVTPGVDWHYGIQHIGAQTRRLREAIRDENIVTACVEADGKSWPTWRSKHAQSSQLIAQVVDSIASRFKGPRTSITLTGHSGGGSFTFGYLNGVDRVSDRIDRIAFLDSNYAYSDEQNHGDKLIAWLKASRRNHLVVIAYDDRNIMLDGKRVVSPTGGTYRRTTDMIARFRKELTLSEAPLLETLPGGAFPATAPAGHASALAMSRRYRGLDGQIDIILVENPQNKILHTVMVGDMSGFIHAITSGTPYENHVAVFGGPVTYEKWIQQD
ncbi:MAG: hypothetical protein GX616_17195 [Planctomycetes bacterium]|nr:hypothetical protein [Planctomycetota bacterium]